MGFSSLLNPEGETELVTSVTCEGGFGVSGAEVSLSSFPG